MSFLRNIFKEQGAKHVITLFHNPSVPSSVRALTLLKQANATAVAHATEDQASSHATQSKLERMEFDLDVQEEPPTPDQLKSILEYIGAANAGEVVSGATSETEALKKLKVDAGSFKRPFVVDWNKGRAVAGDNESEILKLLKATKEGSS